MRKVERRAPGSIEAPIRGRSWLAAAVAALCWMGAGVQSAAQEEAEIWSNTAEISYVLTAGNSSSSTLGVRNTTDFEWGSSSVQIVAGGIRTVSESTTRTATGTTEDFDIVEETTSETTAESYLLKTRYDRTLAASTYLFGSAGWERNTFSGFDNRSSLGTGVGRNWMPGDGRRLKTDVGVTYTIQDDVVENPAQEDSFAGLRATVDFLRPVTETTTLSSALIVDENLSETSDLRADWTGSVAVAISNTLALKTTLQVLFDNDPALVAVPLGAEQVLVPLEKVDSVFTVSLVVNL